MSTPWLANHPQVKFSPKGYATAETFNAFLSNLKEDVKQVFLDQDQYRRSVLTKPEHLARFQFLLLPAKTTKHSQPIDQLIHHRLKWKFKSDSKIIDFTISLGEIITKIEAELTRHSFPYRPLESAILASWHLVRRKFPPGSEITRTLPPRQVTRLH
jgi:hypothetical protein